MLDRWTSWTGGALSGRDLSEVVPGVLVATSERYLTTSTVVVGGSGRCVVVDPALTAGELEGLAAQLRAHGLRPVAGFATHAHWDHILWCAALGPVPRYATATTVSLAGAHRAQLLSDVDGAAPGHDSTLVGRLTALEPSASTLPWDGPELQVVAHEAHAPGHAGLFLPEQGVLMAGDMCSDVEIPLLDLEGGAPLSGYRQGLERLAGLPDVRWVVPGHGQVGDGREFRRRVGADRAYLDALERGGPVDDQRCAAGWLQAEHQAQSEFVRATGGRA